MNENKKALIVDVENIAAHNVIDDFEKIFNLFNVYDKILLILSHDTRKFKLNLEQILKLNNLIVTSKLNLILIPLNGKNSADYGIIYYAGQISVDYTEIHILSGDRIFDHLTNILRSNNRIGKRIVDFKSQGISI